MHATLPRCSQLQIRMIVPPKERIIGVSFNGENKAYSLAALKKRGTPLDDQIGESRSG